jgi:hypothetical protein
MAMIFPEQPLGPLAVPAVTMPSLRRSFSSPPRPRVRANLAKALENFNHSPVPVADEAV